jgi:N-acetylated-alpha-linked acidic dipeptidase
MLHIFSKTTTYIALFCLVLSGEVFAQQLMGFRGETAKKELDLETTFDKQLQANNLRDWMKLMTAYPHQVGSAYGLKNALFIKEKLTSWGFDTHIDTVHVLFPTPKTRIVELTEPTKFKASLIEKPFKEDATSGQTKDVCLLTMPILPMVMLLPNWFSSIMAYLMIMKSLRNWVLMLKARL